MRIPVFWLLVAGIATLILGVGLSGATSAAQEDSMAGATSTFQDEAPGAETEAGRDVGAVQSAVADTITYQGQVTGAGGAVLNGVHSMRFLLYAAANGGAPLWDSDNLNVEVDDGLFTVELDVDQADFNGQALWLRVDVNGQTLSPRQALHATPYALSLRPGADVAGEPAGSSDAVLGVTLQGNWPSGQALLGSAPTTGTAVQAEAVGGQGLYASSNDNYAVRGSSVASWGGYFTSSEGSGIVVTTGGGDHWDHAGAFQAEGGYGVYASSDVNMAIRGEAGNIIDLWQPVGHVGVVGIGQSRGLYGSGGSSYGLYGTSLNWYGIYGRTSRPDNNYGLYTPDNLFSSNINLTGAVMNVAQNGGEEPLEPGDVVAFSGISEPLVARDSPLIQVARATEANAHAVAGVVYSRFNIEVVALADEDPDPDLEVTPAGPAAPGDHVLVVVQGPAQVRASAVDEAIQAGDLLSVGSGPGLAGKAPLLALEGVQMAAPGTVFAKALAPLSEGQDMIYVYVTLN